MSSPTNVSLDNSPRWKEVAERCQRDRETKIREWAEMTMGTSIPLLPPEKTTNVRDWPVKSGHLDAKQTEITSSAPSHILRMIAKGIWSAEDVLIAYTTRATIAHHLTNPLTDIFFNKGLTRARELDKHFWRTGRTVGPLHGLPISLKDAMNLEAHATTLGFVALAHNVQRSSDELLVRLEKAGAVFYCKTNVPQSLMSGECNNFLYGRTSTPDNRNLSAGGSSGGEGSLVALRGSPLGIGTDIAGSIRTPANFNGVFGLCPTYGRFPCHSAGQSSIGLINGVAGPISSSIDGLELYAKTVLSFEPWKWDATCLPLPWKDEVYNHTINQAAEGHLCFGFVAHDGVVRPHPPIERGFEEAKVALRAAGHEVVDVEFLKSDDGLWDLAVRIFCADGGEMFRKMLAICPEPVIKEVVVPPSSMALSAIELESESKTLLQTRQEFLRRLQDTKALTASGRPVDVLVLPSGAHVAPPHSTMEYFLYEAISNILDWPCATIPVGNVDARLDPKPISRDDFIPLSEEDRKNWEKCTQKNCLFFPKLNTPYNCTNIHLTDCPNTYENGAICLQVLGPRFGEEVVLASMRVLNEALGRENDDLL